MKGKLTKEARLLYSKHRQEQKHGLGFGLNLSQNLYGPSIFYNYNIGDLYQLHIQRNETSLIQLDISLVTGESFNMSRTTQLVTFRRFLTDSKKDSAGFYIGAGLGQSQTVFNYSYLAANLISITETSIDAITGEPIDVGRSLTYDIHSSGSFLLGEGWQGIDGYYFHMGLQHGSYFDYTEDFDEDEVPNVENKSKIIDIWTKGRSLAQLTLGFGWFF